MTDQSRIETAGERPVYTGLAWAPARDRRLVARSETTPATYIVEPLGDGRFIARMGFEQSAGRPNIEIGAFAEERVAVLACERHDWRFWRSAPARAGIDTVFMGSSSHVADFVASLPEHERDDLMDMIAGDYMLPDGRGFATSASYFGATKTGLKQERSGAYTLTLSIQAGDVPLWMMQVAPGASLVLGVVDLEDPADAEWQERGQTALKRCFALEQDNAFHGWMQKRYDRWALIRTAMSQTSTEVEAAVAETLRRVIGCPSRRELLTNRDAIMRLEKIDREFYLDLSRGFGAA